MQKCLSIHCGIVLALNEINSNVINEQFQKIYIIAMIHNFFGFSLGLHNLELQKH